MTPPSVAVTDPTFRLVPSRYPPIGAFENVVSAGDLEAVMELEGWTNDRLVAERLARLPQDQWVYGTPNASIVMASFLHAPPTGTRFASGDLGAWYSGLAQRTAIAEVAHHLRREAVNTRVRSLTLQYRSYTAYLGGAYCDVRKMEIERQDLYAPDNYGASQSFGEAQRAGGADGIIYDSVRHAGGTCIVAFRPRNVRDVVMSAHYEITAPAVGKVVARLLP